MDCEKALELMSAELDGMCTEQERAALQAHLEACADCRETYRQLHALDEALQDAELEPPQAENRLTTIASTSARARYFFFILFLLRMLFCLETVPNLAFIISHSFCEIN